MYENPAANDEKLPRRPIEHLLVAEAGQVSAIFGHGLRHEFVPGRPGRNSLDRSAYHQKIGGSCPACELATRPLPVPR